MRDVTPLVAVVVLELIAGWLLHLGGVKTESKGWGARVALAALAGIGLGWLSLLVAPYRS